MAPDISHVRMSSQDSLEQDSNKQSEQEEESVIQNGFHDDDDVVITGMSARLSNWRNVDDYVESLSRGTTASYPIGTSGFLSARHGKTRKRVEQFDWNFFDVSPPEDESAGAELGTLLELTFEAIMDAGVNPTTVKNSSTGVFISSAQKFKETKKHEKQGTTPASSISKAFQFQGPAFTTEAPSSNLYPLVRAVRSIRMGLCDAAIVGCTQPIRHHRLASDDGETSSEAVILYICRGGSHVKRCYASVIDARMWRPAESNGVINEQYKAFLKRTYSDAGFLTYLEVGDEKDLEFFNVQHSSNSQLLCRLVPHGETTVRGMCEFAQTVVALHRGIVPAGWSGSEEARIQEDTIFKIVTKNTHWDGGIAAIDTTDAEGTHTHIIFTSEQRKPYSEMEKRVIPTLIPFSGRTKHGIEQALGCVSRLAGANQQEIAALLQEIAIDDIEGHDWRGYSIVTAKKNVGPEVKEIDVKSQRPVWFAFTGMGSQWDGMGRDLIRFKGFKESIDKCAKALETVGFDLYDAIMNSSKGKEQGELLMGSMVSIAAFHVALVDLLRSIGISPDGMLGHSSGEVGCAYADGCMTAEETVLLSHARVKALLEMKYPPGCMAIIGLSLEEAEARKPPDIDIACHNNRDNVTAAGPRDSIRNFVSKLTAQGVYAVVVETHGMPFHSRYILSSEPRMLELCEVAAPVRRARTERWISTSLVQSEWESWKEHSAAYQVHNLMVPVYYEEALRHVPENAVVIEIAPTCILQPLLKKGTPSGCIHIGLLDKTAPDGAVHLMKSIGRMYNAGLNPKIGSLYDRVAFPVSNQALSISSLMRWDD